MVRIRSKIKACVLACALLGAPTFVLGAGMGKMNVLSGLGQPLLAEIDLVSVQEDELAGMTARLASPEMFREAQLQYPSHLSGLKFAIEKRPNGTRYVKVTSSNPVSEPFIDVLIELNWQTGRLVREFTALLDPLGDQSPKIDQTRVPQTQVVTSDSLAKQQGAAATSTATGKPGRSFARKGPRVDEPGMPEAFKTAKADAKAAAEKAEADAKAAAEAKAAAKDEAKPETPKPAPVAVARKPKPAVQPKPVAETPADVADGYKVKAGESLAQIAGKLKPEGINLEQMLVGLYQTNQDAFINGNMNRLRAGKILSVPEKEKLESISPEQAVKEIRTHSSDWNSYRQKLAEAVAKAPTEAAPGSKSGASGKLAAKVEDKAAPPPGASKEVLKLSRGDAKGKAAAVGQSAEDKNAAAEDQIAREKALKDANDRVANLQKNISEMQKLLEMKNKAAADLQSQAAKPAEAPKPAPQAEPAAAQPAPAAEQPSAAPTPAAPAAPSVAAKPATPPSKPSAPPPAPAPEPGMFDSLMDNPLLVGGGLAGIGLLGGVAFLLAKRRKRPSFEDSIITGGDLRANTVLGNTGGAIINTNATESSFLTDFSRAGLGTIDTDEVDPIAEAEVYMAYGRDAQAEEILKDALIKDPSRQEIRLKLLEIYAGRKNTASFEDVASELYSATEGKGQLWANAAQMGRDLDPGNPLYKTAGEPEDQFVKTQVIDRTAAVAQAPVVVAAPAEAPEAEDVAELDFDLGEPAVAAKPQPAAAPSVAATPVAEETNVLDFDLGDFSLPETPAAQPEIAVAPPTVTEPEPALEEVKADDKEMLDFDFQLDTPVTEAPKAATEVVAEPENIDLSLELPPLEEAPEEMPQAAVDLGLDDSDPMATKIDLARAYIDMGDKEGAREILMEVVQEGAENHQVVAKQLLEQI